VEIAQDSIWFSVEGLLGSSISFTPHKFKGCNGIRRSEAKLILFYKQINLVIDGRKVSCRLPKKGEICNFTLDKAPSHCYNTSAFWKVFQKADLWASLSWVRESPVKRPAVWKTSIPKYLAAAIAQNPQVTMHL